MRQVIIKRAAAAEKELSSKEEVVIPWLAFFGA